MDDNKKIILGSEDFLAKGVDDIFININLKQTFNQIKKDKYDNNFDLSEQFRQERNLSRDFRVYGIIDSTIIDSDGLKILVYKDSGLTQLHSSIDSTELVYEEDNVFNKKRGKFLLELNSYDSDLVYLKIPGNNITYGDQVFEQRLVFYTLDGEFVEYGTETIDVGLNNPGFLEIENDFPFFYNKHWIKKDLKIIEEKPTVMQFGSSSSVVSEGNSVSIEITMDKPSPFGNESVILEAVLGTVLPADYSLSISGSPISFPTVINWSQGEQNKTFNFDAINDDVNEFSEDIRFDLSNFQFTNSGLTTSHFAVIEDTTERRFTNYHLGEIYKNRLEFTGRTVQWNTTSNTFETTAYSILRNGLHFDKKNEAFYPGDTYQLSVTNKGVDTILPVNESLGIITEQLWPANSTKIFNIDTEYTVNDKNKVKIIFPTSGVVNDGILRINGVNMQVGSLSYVSVRNRIVDGFPNDWLPFNGLEKDWTAEENFSNSAITITSKTSGLPVLIDIIETFAPGSLPAVPGQTPYVIEIEPFVEGVQIPKTLSLLANANANNFTFYEFSFIKEGYNGISVSAKTHFASTSGVDKHLVTSFDKISRNWDDSEDDCIYSSSATPPIGYPITELPDGTPYTAATLTNYLWPVGIAHINGSVLLTQNNLLGSKQNYTSILTADFKDFPLIPEDCTDSDLLSNSIKQKIKITFPNTQSSGSWCGNDKIPYQTNRMSFDFRTGTTGSFTTFYKSGILLNTIASNIGWNNTILTSGATLPSPTGLLKEHLDIGSSSLPVGSLEGTQIDSWGGIVILESKVSGVPFEIVNIVPNYYHTAYPGSSWPDPTCPPVSAGTISHIITYELLRPNGIAGVSLNSAKNWMNGYNTLLQTGQSGGVPIGSIPPVTPPLSFN